MQQLRAQVPVLKKAVLDEQANEEQLKVTCTVKKIGTSIILQHWQCYDILYEFIWEGVSMIQMETYAVLISDSVTVPMHHSKFINTAENARLIWL